MKTTVFEIKKNDSNLLKGFGILIIIFHNYFHLLHPIVGENEYSFNAEYFQNYINFTTKNLWNFIQYLSAYFGHYGVPLFVFLSGYGLTKSYANRTLIFKGFIKKRLLKLYPTFSLGLVLVLIYQYGFFGMPFTFRTVGSIFIRFTQIANFLPNKAFTFSSTYWFYSMIIQLYFCFPILLWIHKRFKFGLPIFLISSYLIIILTNTYFSSIGLSLYLNFVGNLPVFIFGILLALRKSSIKPSYYFLPALLFFILGQFFETLWHLTQVSFVILILFFFELLQRKVEKTVLTRFIGHTGQLSMYLFAVSGLLRVPWVEMSNATENSWDNYVYFIIYLIITYVMATVLKKTEVLLHIAIRKRRTSTR